MNKELHFSKHGGVHGAFGEHYIKPGLFNQKYHRWLLNAFDKRIVGDYGTEAVFTKDEVQEMITQANELLDKAYQFLAEGS